MPLSMLMDRLQCQQAKQCLWHLTLLLHILHDGGKTVLLMHEAMWLQCLGSWLCL